MRQRRWLSVGAAIVLALALIAGLIAWQQNRVNAYVSDVPFHKAC